MGVVFVFGVALLVRGVDDDGLTSMSDLPRWPVGLEVVAFERRSSSLSLLLMRRRWRSLPFIGVVGDGIIFWSCFCVLSSTRDTS